MSKIIIIDESDHYTKMIRMRLRNFGYEDVESFVDAEEALKALEVSGAGLVLVDTRVNLRDGFGVSRLIKEKYDSHVKVILMSGLTEVFDITKAQEAKADEYVIKTFDCALLMTAIKKALFQLENLKENV